MTVQHLRQKMQHGRQSNLTSTNTEAAEADQARFCTGYLACAQEVQRCIGALPLGATHQSRLCDHLAGCLRSLQQQQQQLTAADLASASLGCQKQQQAKEGYGKLTPTHTTASHHAPSRRHASLSSESMSSASSVTSSPPASPISHCLDSGSPLREYSSVAAAPVAACSVLMSPTSSQSSHNSDVFSSYPWPNSLPILLRNVVQYPADVKPSHDQQCAGLPSPVSDSEATSRQPPSLATMSGSKRSGDSPISFMHPKKRIRYSCSPDDLAPSNNCSHMPLLSPKLPGACLLAEGPMWRPWWSLWHCE